MAYRRPQGTGFVGLGDYLQANQGSAQMRTGQALAEQVEKEGAAAQRAIDSASETFANRAQSANVAFQPIDTNGYQQEQARVQQAQKDWETKAAAARASGDQRELDRLREQFPTMAAPTVRDEAARRAKLATYLGPNNLSDVADTSALATKADNAQRTAQLAGTDAGRAVLQDKTYEGRTDGGRVLDSFLTGRGGGERLDAASARYNKLGQYLTGAQDTAEKTAASGKQQAQNVQNQYGQVEEFKPDVATRPTWEQGHAGYWKDGQWVSTEVKAPAPKHPRVQNAEDVAEDNRRKARAGFRG